MFWDAVVRDLGIPFATPYEQVLDVSRRPGLGALVRRRHAQPHATTASSAGPTTPRTRAARRSLWEDEAGAVRSLTYAELAHAVAQCAEGLEALGVGAGDAVGAAACRWRRRS